MTIILGWLPKRSTLEDIFGTLLENGSINHKIKDHEKTSTLCNCSHPNSM